MKYLKFVALMLCVAVSATVFNACSKDDKTSSTTTNTNAPTSVADTEWEWYDPDATDVYRVQVEFNGPMLVSVIKEGRVDDMLNVQSFMGTYTYSGGRNTRVDSYNANGILSQYFVNEYDKSGNLICESAYDIDDNLLEQHRSTYRNGLIYREEFQGKDKQLQWYTTYTYSEQYLKVLKTTYSGDGRELEQLEQSCLLFDR